MTCKQANASAGITRSARIVNCVKKGNNINRLKPRNNIVIDPYLARYYGDALQGTPQDCKKCPCPNDGPCAEFYNYQSQSVDVVCLQCPTGTRGNLCDICEDGWHQVGSSTEGPKCEKCLCNGNIDENAVGNCDHLSGECLRCVHNTTGGQCERCLDSHWGNALTDLKCHACECSPIGSNNPDNCRLISSYSFLKENVNVMKEIFFNCIMKALILVFLPK